MIIDEMIIGFIGVIKTIILSSISLANWLGRKFSTIDFRFNLIDEKFRQINERFKIIDERFKQIDDRFKDIDNRLKSFEERLDLIEKRSSSLENKFGTLGEYIKSVYLTLIDFMTLRGVFSEDERRYMIRELDRLSEAYKISANPLKPEEYKFIKEVIKELMEKPSKEIDLWKLEKIVEIAERLTREEPSRTSFEFWMKAYMLYAMIRSEKFKEEEKKLKKDSC